MEPCVKCGFAGRINAWKLAKVFKRSQVIIPCPQCGGRGKPTLPVIRTILWIRAVGIILFRRIRHQYRICRFKRKHDAIRCKRKRGTG